MYIVIWFEQWPWQGERCDIDATHLEVLRACNWFLLYSIWMFLFHKLSIGILVLRIEVLQITNIAFTNKLLTTSPIGEYDNFELNLGISSFWNIWKWFSLNLQERDFHSSTFGAKFQMKNWNFHDSKLSIPWYPRILSLGYFKYFK